MVLLFCQCYPNLKMYNVSDFVLHNFHAPPTWMHATSYTCIKIILHANANLQHLTCRHNYPIQLIYVKYCYQRNGCACHVIKTHILNSLILASY